MKEADYAAGRNFGAYLSAVQEALPPPDPTRSPGHKGSARANLLKPPPLGLVRHQHLTAVWTPMTECFCTGILQKDSA
jgi:hypothetical protein